MFVNKESISVVILPCVFKSNTKNSQYKMEKEYEKSSRLAK